MEFPQQPNGPILAEIRQVRGGLPPSSFRLPLSLFIGAHIDAAVDASPSP
jgi:hypothetical protein